MSTPRLNPFPILRASLLAAFLMFVVSLSAVEGGFSAALSAEQMNSTGLTMLGSGEREALDHLVAGEVSQARQEGSGELEGTFFARRTDGEKRQAGLDRLTPGQLTQLNALVAAAVAASPKPKERPRIRDADVFSAPKKPEVHGEFSLTYGRDCDGSSFRGASMWVDYFDPNSGLGFSVGISRSTSKGLFGFYPGDYGLSSLYGAGYPGNFGWPYRNSFEADNWSEAGGRSFRTSLDMDRSYNREFRRR